MVLSESTVQSPIIRPIEPSRLPRGIVYRDGFRIIGTPLGFGRSRDAKLRFISSLEETPPKKSERILMSRPLFKAMGCEDRNMDVLAVDFGRKIRLGRMEIELFPAGLGPGSSQLKILFRNRQILYCGGIRLAKPLFSLPPEVPRCDLLLLDVCSADPKPDSPSRAAKELSLWLEKGDAAGPSVVACGSRTAAINAMWVLKSASAKVYATRGLFEILRRCAEFFGPCGNLFRLEQILPKEGFLLVSADTWAKSRFYRTFTEKQIAFVGAKNGCPDWASTSFRLGEGEDRIGLESYVRQTGASQVVLGQHCDDTLVRRLSKTEVDLYRVTRPVQIPFPFLSQRL